MQTRRRWRDVRSKGEIERAYGSASTTYNPKNLLLKMVMSHLGCGSIESDSSNSHYTTTYQVEHEVTIWIHCNR